MRLHTRVYGHRKETLHWKLTVGEKSLAAPGNRTCVGSVPVRCSTNWSTSPPIYIYIWYAWMVCGMYVWYDPIYTGTDADTNKILYQRARYKITYRRSDNTRENCPSHTGSRRYATVDWMCDRLSQHVAHYLTASPVSYRLCAGRPQLAT